MGSGLMTSPTSHRVGWNKKQFKNSETKRHLTNNMKHTLRFRAYLSDDVASEAWRHIDIFRQIRNRAVRDYYNSNYDERPTEFDQNNRLTEWAERWQTVAEPSQHAAQQAISQIHSDLETL
jgi:putative transposase